MNGNVNKETELLLLLGSNKGDRLHNIHRAVELIESRIGDIIQESHLYKTEPWGKKDQPGFINLGLKVKTTCSPEDVLKKIINIESDLGRDRTKEERWGERIIDVDIILMNDLIIKTDDLQIPHPEMQNRNFVLIPLNEIAPGALHPVFKRTIKELFEDCEDVECVNKLKN